MTFSKTVLIIEDETDTAEMLAEMMRLSDYSSLHAYTAQQALTLLTNHKPDLILLDIILPDFSGLELLRKIRQIPQFEDSPVIIITGNSQPLDIQNGYISGASAYLTKPVAFWELKETIVSLMK